MKKLTVVTIVICLLLSLAGCGSSDTSAFEKRLKALEEENARLAEQLDSIAKQLEISTESKSPKETQVSSSSQQSEGSIEQLHQKGFYKDVAASSDSYSYYNYASENGDARFYIGNYWSEVEAGDRLVLEADRGWIDVILTYEIDPSISSAPECEKKIRAITETFPSEGVEEECVRNGLFLQDFISYLTGQREFKGVNGGEINFDDTWWVSIIEDKGADYCREKSTHNGAETINYSLLDYEAYLFMSDTELGALHISCKVISYNYQGYYDSLGTTIEKNNVQQEQENFLLNMAWFYNASSGRELPFRYLLKPYNNTTVTVGK